MSFKLTAGAIEATGNKGPVPKMFRWIDGVDMSNDKEIVNPILKLKGHKVVPGGAGGQTRYRLLLTDGITTHSFAMLATQLNHMIEQGKIEVNTVIRVKKYVCNHVQNNKCVLIVLDLDVLGVDSSPDVAVPASEPVRQPLQPSLHSATVAGTNMPKRQQASNYPPQQPATPPKSRDRQPQSSGTTPGTPGTGGLGRVFPIQSLNPYQNRWCIRARVSQKSSVRTWNNARGEGKLFSFTVADESGEIRATCFKAEVDKFYDMIQLEKVYYISRATLKAANKQFNNTNNDYEMTLNNDTQIVLVEDEDTSSLPQTHFNFVPIGKLDQSQAGDYVDIVGVVHESPDVQNIVSKTTQKELTKRDISVVDNSGCLIKLTMWGTEAVDFDGSSHPAIVIKSAKLTDFGGRSLSTVSCSSILIAPSHVPEAIRMKGWYEHEGRSLNFESYRGEGAGGVGGGGSADWKLMSEVKSGGIGMGDKPDYFTVKGTVVHMKKENSMYQACSSDNCNKKVVDLGSGLYRCEKCNRETPTFSWRLLLQINVADMTDNQWATAFQDSGEMILSKTADELGAMRSSENEAEFDSVFQEANFNSFIFRMRAKMETYNDENRLRVVVVDAKPIDYKDYNKRLLENITQLSRELPAS